MKNYKVKAIQTFTYKEFNTLEFVEKENFNGNFIYKNDVFYCTKEQAEYLSGNNKKKLVGIEVLEVQTNIENINEQVIDTIVDEVVESKEVNEVIDEVVDKVVEEIIGKKKKRRKK